MNSGSRLTRSGPSTEGLYPTARYGGAASIKGNDMRYEIRDIEGRKICFSWSKSGRDAVMFARSTGRPGYTAAHAAYAAPTAYERKFAWEDRR